MAISQTTAALTQTVFSPSVIALRAALDKKQCGSYQETRRRRTRVDSREPRAGLVKHYSGLLPGERDSGEEFWIGFAGPAAAPPVVLKVWHSGPS
jgi:hypothetical protein